MEGRKGGSYPSTPFSILQSGKKGVEQLEFTWIIIPAGSLKGWCAVRTLQKMVGSAHPTYGQSLGQWTLINQSLDPEGIIFTGYFDRFSAPDSVTM